MKKVILLNLLLLVLLAACSSKDDLDENPGDNSPIVTDPIETNPIVTADETYNVLVEANITYAEGLSHDGQSSSTVAMPLILDLYKPDNASKNRPVFMFMHGGSFLGGSRKKTEIVAMANYFASRGWVFLSIDYRTASNLGTINTGIAPQLWREFCNDDTQINAIYTAQRDAKSALRWIVANAETYHINTDYITVGGGSAGAITAIGIAVSEQEDFRDEISTTIDPTLLSTNLNVTYNIRSIIDFWGNDTVLSLLENVYGHERFGSNDPELFIAHGTEDIGSVPYSGALDLIEIYNSNGVYAKLVPLEGEGHAAWGATVDDKSLSDLSFDFLVERQNLTVEN